MKIIDFSTPCKDLSGYRPGSCRAELTSEEYERECEIHEQIFRRNLLSYYKFDRLLEDQGLWLKGCWCTSLFCDAVPEIIQDGKHKIQLDKYEYKGEFSFDDMKKVPNDWNELVVEL